MLQLIEPYARIDISGWPFGRSDLHHWADLLDRFDSYYETIITSLWNNETGVQDKEFTSVQCRLLVSMLGFTRCLLEYCSSRNLFNSYEYLKSFLATKSLEVLEANLELLCLPARKLEAQQSLRKTFQETIGVEELAILGHINHPPFIEFHQMRSRPINQEAFRRLHADMTGHHDLHVVKMMSMSIYMLFMSTLDIELDSSLFSGQPTIIGDTARSLNVPKANLSNPLRKESASIALLRAALKVPSKSNEVVYALSLSAGHGPVSSILRVICDALREQKDLEYHQFFVSAFLDFCTALGMSFEADLAMVQAGCVETLVRSTGNVQHHQYKLCERILTILDILLHRLPEALDAFFLADGIHLIVSQIASLVPGSHELDHSEGSLLNAHMRLIDRLLESTGGDDRLRNLVEGSLFKSIKAIFEQPARFPQETLSFSVSLLSGFIHHEPTSLSFLQEQEVPQAFLKAIQNHPIPPQSDLIVKLPLAFSALCLNPTGVQQFTDCNPIAKLLNVFSQPDVYLRALKNHMAAGELGRGLDEFMRHQPIFKDSTIACLVDVLKGMSTLLQQVPLYQLNSEESSTSLVTFSDGLERMKKREPHPSLTMFDLFTITLEGILQSPGHAKEFVISHGMDELFSLYSTPGLPYDFVIRAESHSIAHLFRLLSESQGSPEETPVDVLGCAWHHVFECSNIVAAKLLKFRKERPGDAFFTTASIEEQNETFKEMSSILAILGLLSDLYMHHSFTAARQACQVIPTLNTSEGQSAITFLSALLGACVSERQLLEKTWSSRLELLGRLENALKDTSTSTDATNDSMSELIEDPTSPSFKNNRAVLFVTGKIPGLVMSLFGGISRMLGYQSSTVSLRRSVNPPNEVELQNVSRLLAMSLSLNIRDSTPEILLSVLNLALTIFFDESSSRMTIQALPLSIFASLSALEDLSKAVMDHISKINDTNRTVVLQVFELYLILLGRITNVQTYRQSTWEDLGTVGEPAGLRNWVFLAAKTAYWCWIDLPIWSQLESKHVRLLLTLTSNLLLQSCDIGCNDLKPQEACFVDFLTSCIYPDIPTGKTLGHRFEVNPTQKAIIESEMTWLSNPPVNIITLIVERTQAYPTVIYDTVHVLVHLFVLDSVWLTWFDMMISSHPTYLLRALSIAFNSFRRLDILRNIASQRLVALFNLIKTQLDDPCAFILASELVALMTSTEASPIHMDTTFISDMKSTLLSRISQENVDYSHASLLLLVALSRIPNLFTAEEVGSLVPRLIALSLTMLDSNDIRHRSMPNLAMLCIRHFIEGDGEYLGRLMDPELAAKHKSFAARRLPLSQFLPTLANAPPGTESLAVRNWSVFIRMVQRVFQFQPGTESNSSCTEEMIVRSEVTTLEYKRSLLEQLYDVESCPMVIPVMTALLEEFLSIPSLPVFESAEASVKAESDPTIASSHFRRVAYMLAISELIACFPAAHTALLASSLYERFLTVLFDEMVPCGDLAQSGGQAASTLYVTGPVWVDYLISQICIGSSVPGLPAPLDRMQANGDSVIRILAQVIQKNIDYSSFYALMSRYWCLSMTVYSMLNMRGTLHRQTEAVQSCVARSMLESRFMSILAKILGGFRSEWPGHSMVAAKLVLNLETLARHAKELAKSLPKSFSSSKELLSIPDDGAGEAMDVDETEEGLDDLSDDSDSDSDEDEEMEDAMPAEEFGYAQSNSESEEGSSEMDIDISIDGTSADDSDSDTATTYTTSDEDDSDMDDFGEFDEDVEIIMQPNASHDNVAGLGEVVLDSDASDMNEFYDDVEHQGEDDVNDEEDLDEDGFEEDEGSLIGFDSDEFDDMDENEDMDEQAEGMIRRLPGRRRPFHRDNFLDSLFPSNLGFGMETPSAFSNLVARGANSGDLYSHPLLGRDIESPACVSIRLTDLALLLRQPDESGSTTATTTNTMLMTPFRAPQVSGPFTLNREALRTPGTATTIRRWAQESKLLYGPPNDILPFLLDPVIEAVRKALLPEWQESMDKAKAEREMQKSEQTENEAVSATEKKEESAPATTTSTTTNPTTADSWIASLTDAMRQATASARPQLPPGKNYLMNCCIYSFLVEFVDAGPDVEFLLALPFDMRAEVIQQYFINERRAAINTAVGSSEVPIRVTIDAEFMQRLSSDLRQEYQRLSDRDVDRFNARRAAPPRPSNNEGNEEEEEEDYDDYDDEMMMEMEEMASLFGIGNQRDGAGAPPPAAQLLSRLAETIRTPAATSTASTGGRLAEMLNQLQDTIHRGNPGFRVEVISGGIDHPEPLPLFGRQSPTRGLLEGKLSPIPPSALSLDSQTLATILRSYYDPSMSDKRTHHKLLSALCSLRVDSSSASVREELIGMLILVLEQMPNDLEALEKTLHLRTNATVSVTSPMTVVILQRTLQLLYYLVSHDDTTKHFFTRPSTTTWTVKRSDRTLLKASSPSATPITTQYEIKYPIVLLLACLEKGPILQVGLLVEFLLSLIATVSGPIRVILQERTNLTQQLTEAVEEERTRINSKLDALPVPVIPTPFLHSLIKALCASELTPKAINHVTVIFQNFSKLDGLSGILLKELADSATSRVLEQTGRDLAKLFDALCGDIDEAAVTVALKNMSSPVASQTRLLRLLKMMLVLLPSTEKSPTSSLDEAVVKHVNSELEKPIWTANLMQKLPALLHSLDSDKLHVAMGLLPSIEAFFLHHRILDLLQNQKDLIDESKVILFAEEHRKLLNAMIRSSSSLLSATSGSFHVLTQAPKVLDFDNKRTFFKSQIAQLKKLTPSSVINMNVRRAYVFEDSYHQLIGRTGDELRSTKLSVKFHGEEGVDAGGVTREWYTELCKKMFNPDNGLFLPSALDSVTLQPNRMSWVNPDHLQFFAFVGRILGKAISDGRLLDCHFTRSFYKHMLGLPVDFKDLEAIDPDYHKSLQWILDNDITDVLDDLTFATETDEFGVRTMVELKSGGTSIPVTESNKAEYVRLVTEYRLTTAIRPQIDAVLRGLHALIPPSLLAIFSESELELLISGLPDIDIDDWRAHTVYRSYTIASPQVQWFWRAVRSFDPEERAKLVQFVTGTAKVPLEGWAHLQGSSGRQSFAITKDFGATHRLPSAHTCFNQLDLPAYESYEELRAMILKAINEGATGFGLI